MSKSEKRINTVPVQISPNNLVSQDLTVTREGRVVIKLKAFVAVEQRIGSVG